MRVSVMRRTAITFYFAHFILKKSSRAGDRAAAGGGQGRQRLQRGPRHQPRLGGHQVGG